MSFRKKNLSLPLNRIGGMAEPVVLVVVVVKICAYILFKFFSWDLITYCLNGRETRLKIVIIIMIIIILIHQYRRLSVFWFEVSSIREEEKETVKTILVLTIVLVVVTNIAVVVSVVLKVEVLQLCHWY